MLDAKISLVRTHQLIVLSSLLAAAAFWLYMFGCLSESHKDTYAQTTDTEIPTSGNLKSGDSLVFTTFPGIQ